MGKHVTAPLGAVRDSDEWRRVTDNGLPLNTLMFPTSTLF
jgi:hypothetical protein